jgi:hypothetical protein
MDPIHAIASATALLEGIKKAREVAKRVNNAEMQGVLLDAQEQALALKEEVLALRTENQQLREQITQQHDVYFEDSAYWTRTESGRDGPYCSLCYEDAGKRISMRPQSGNRFWCPRCQKSCSVTSVPPRPKPAPRRFTLP